MSDAPMALVAGHGEFAYGMISAVSQITGRDDLFFPLSNKGLSAVDIERVMREAIDARGIRVIFTDLPAGSCTIAARRIIASRNDLVLITGVSLPVLLDFMCHAELSPTDAAAHAVDRAVRSLAAIPGATRGH